MNRLISLLLILTFPLLSFQNISNKEQESIEGFLGKELLRRNLQTKIPLGKNYIFKDAEGYAYTLKIINEIYPSEIRYLASGGLVIGSRNYAGTSYISPKKVSSRYVSINEVELIPEGTLMHVEKIQTKKDGIEIILKKDDLEAKVKLMMVANLDFDTAMITLGKVFEIESIGILHSSGEGVPKEVSSIQEVIEKLSSIIAEGIAKAKKRSVAVVDFVDLHGNVSEFGRFLAEEFSVSLAGSDKGFEVIERTHLKTILEEHKLAITGLINIETAKQLGKIIGVEAIVTGSIVSLERSVRVSIKVLDIATGKIISAQSGDIAKTKAVEELLAKGIEKLPAAPGVPATPTPSTKKALREVEGYGFLFKLQNCKLSANSIICYFTVTNNMENDRNLTIYLERNRLIDDSGNEFHANYLQFGSKETTYWYVTNTMVSGIPTNFSLYFNGIPSSCKSIALLEIYCESGIRFTVQIRNIPLSK